MRKMIASGIFLTILASPTLAAKQYWIVEQAKNSCTVIDEKPKTTITIRGNNDGYASRAEAERSLKTTKGCIQE
jgi:hypothetical protein